MNRHGSLAILSLILVAACTTASGTPAPTATGSGSAAPTRPPGSPAAGSNDPSGAPISAVPARLLFRRTTATADGRAYALLLLDPARSDLAQSPERGASPDVRHVEWSPDGTRLLAWANDRDETSLLIIPVDGSPVVRIDGDARLTWQGAWSPDGRSIAFSRPATPRPGAGPSAPPDQAPYEIVVAAADGSASQVVAEGILPSWSPDGRLLASFRRDPSGTDALWVTDVASGGARQLAARFPHPGQGVVGDPALWTPDGRSLVAIGDGSRCAICLIDATTGATRPIAMEAIPAAVPPGANEADIVGWAADKSLLISIQGPTSAVIRVAPTGETVSTVVRLDALIDEVALTPDRTAFAFTRVDPGTRTSSIWYVGVDGTGLRALVPPAAAASDDQPRWQPVPAAVSWPTLQAPEATPEPSSSPGTVDLTITGRRDATVRLPARCAARPDGTFGIEAGGDGYGVQIGLGPDGAGTFFSIGFADFLAFPGKSFELKPPFVVVEPGATITGGTFAFSDLPNADGVGPAGKVSGRATWRCDAVAN